MISDIGTESCWTCRRRRARRTCPFGRI